MPDHYHRKWRIRKMAAVTLLWSLLPFAAVEVAVRASANLSPVEPAWDAIVDLEELRPLFQLDASTQRYVIPNSRSNYFQSDSFAAEKSAGTQRVFVLGGSTVQGRPYGPPTAFSTWLRLRLEAAAPESRFEIVNAGGVSYASYRVAKIIDEVLEYEPDAIVLYVGHNEFLEDRTYEHLRSLNTAQRAATQIAKYWKTVGWLQRTLTGLEKTESPQSAQATKLAREVSAKLDLPGGLESYHRDPRWQAGVQTHFHLTMRNMLQACVDAEVPVLACVPASDFVNTPPFKVEPDPTLGGRRLRELENEWKVVSDSDASPEQRLEAAQRILLIDPHHCGAAYTTGRFEYEQGQTETALENLQRAVDQDVCPLRATSSIVSSTRRLAAQFGIPMIDTVAVLDQRNYQRQIRPDSLADAEFFLDHVHPTIAGHQQIAAAIAQVLIPTLGLSIEAGAESRYRQRAADQLASLDESYFGRGKQRLQGLKQWAAGRAGQKISDAARQDADR